MLQYDDQLEADAEAFLKLSDSSSESQAFFYLWGFNVSTDDEPLIQGKKIYQSIKKGEQNLKNRVNLFTYEKYPEEKKLPLL